jgi:3-polyprenyl-4-hydroxybenzoate decarboxylase
MVGENFRSWLEAWEKSGWLTRIPKAVDPKYILGAITKKLGKEKAVLFEQVSGYAVPLDHGREKFNSLLQGSDGKAACL